MFALQLHMMIWHAYFGPLCCADALYTAGNASTAIRDSHFEDLAVGFSGGVAYMRDNSSVSVSNITVRGNRAQWGAGFMCDHDSVLVVNTSLFWQNSAERHGGGINAIKNCKVRAGPSNNICAGICAPHVDVHLCRNSVRDRAAVASTACVRMCATESRVVVRGCAIVGRVAVPNVVATVRTTSHQTLSNAEHNRLLQCSFTYALCVVPDHWEGKM
jgi:hypothetical protein